MDKDHIMKCKPRYALYLFGQLLKGESMGTSHTFAMVLVMFVVGAGIATLGFIIGNEAASTAGIGLMTMVGGYVIRDKQDGVIADVGGTDV